MHILIHILFICKIYRRRGITYSTAHGLVLNLCGINLQPTTRSYSNCNKCKLLLLLLLIHTFSVLSLQLKKLR